MLRTILTSFVLIYLPAFLLLSLGNQQLQALGAVICIISPFFVAPIAHYWSKRSNAR